MIADRSLTRPRRLFMNAFDCPGFLSGRVRRATTTALSSLAAVLLAAGPADATFHIAHIHRLMTGLNGTTDVQYVEIEMDALGQTQINGSKLIAFKADGSFDHVITTISGASISSGKDRPWIMASAAFAAAAGITPNVLFDSTGGKGMFPEDGMVCWGKPVDQTDPNSTDMVDCVSYGNYTGPANDHISSPSPIQPFGHGLVAVAFTGDGATDFACEDPAKPRNNVPTSGTINASTPCTVAECGNGNIEEPETCDDGDTDFVPGDLCSADCVAFPCGIPTKVNGLTPTTSDALFVLRAAVQSSNCDLLVCDVNASGGISTSDALLILRVAVGLDLPLNCQV
jgi:cysteine-rich repeat protein